MNNNQNRALIRRGFMALVLLIYILFAFFPFQWDPPRHISNHAHYLAGNTIRFEGVGIAHSQGPPKWLARAIRLNHLSLSLRVRPATTYQHGRARIMTLSRDPKHSNFTIIQAGRDLVFRLRARWSDRQGRPPIRVLNVFQKHTWTNIRINIVPDSLRIAVNDIARVHEKLRRRPFKTWSPNYRLALGNDFALNHPWRGEISRAVVNVGGARIDYARKGPLQTPASFWYFHRRPILIPSLQMKPRGVVLNIGGFLPLGILLGLWAPRRKNRNIKALGLIAFFSATLESLQLCFAHRYPSVNDLILNTLGGGCGIVLAHWLPYLLRKFVPES